MVARVPNGGGNGTPQGGIHSPTFCKARIHNRPGQQEHFDVDPCPNGQQCTNPVSQYFFIELTHSVFGQVVQTSQVFFSAWTCR